MTNQQWRERRLELMAEGMDGKSAGVQAAREAWREWEEKQGRRGDLAASVECRSPHAEIVEGDGAAASAAEVNHNERSASSPGSTGFLF